MTYEYRYVRIYSGLFLFLSCSSFIEMNVKKGPNRLEEFTGYLLFRRNDNNDKEYLLIKKPKNEFWLPPEAPTVYDSTTEKEEIEEAEEPRPHELYEETGLTRRNVTFIPHFCKSYEYISGRTRNEITYTIAKVFIPEIEIKLPVKKSEYKWVLTDNLFNLTDDTRQKAFEDAEEFLKRGGYNAYF